LLIPADADFAALASDFIAAGRGEGMALARRRAARAQFEAEQKSAQDQMARLIGWAAGEEMP
jgi:hypothetical protein